METTGMNAQKIEAEIAKLMAETAKINAEAGKITRETFWYPVAISTGLITAVGLAVKFLPS